MIEVTEEMRRAFADAAGWPPAPWMFGPDVERGIAAVLELAEQDRTSAEAERDTLRALLAELVDTDPCQFDHNGRCQAHSLHSAPCPHARAKEVLATDQ